MVNWSSVFQSNFVQVDSFVLRNRQLLKPKNLYRQDDLSKIIEQIKLKVNTTDAGQKEKPDQVVITKGIIIHSAHYGANGKLVDLTTKISDFFAKDILEFRVDNSLADGKDPIVGTLKTLEISCSINGQKKRIDASEGATIKIR